MTINPQKSVVVVVGPTAVGKSRMALKLASVLDGEIICCDSMQIYRDIMILSDRPDDTALAQVPHHLYGHVALDCAYDVQQYYTEARETIADIITRGKRPIVVGGSGLYYRVLLEGVFEGVGKSESFRQALTTRWGQGEAGVIYSELQQQDPDAAMKVHPNDAKRVIRALEVLHLTGRSITQLKKMRSGLIDDCEVKVIGLNCERAALYERINQRVDHMFAVGVIEEVKAIRSKALSLTARQLIGVEDICQYLDGKMDLKICQNSIKQQSRKYAKRQLTWFRHDPYVCWVMTDGLEDDMLQKQIIAKLV